MCSARSASWGSGVTAKWRVDVAVRAVVVLQHIVRGLGGALGVERRLRLGHLAVEV